MAYNKDFPADDSYLADFPANEREQIRAIVEDKIVNAGKLNGLNSSNDTGQVPVSNGTVNTNLNADMLDGHHEDYFSKDGHVHNNASTSTAGFMSAADKTKLDGVATGAEVNQNAFGNVAVGTSTLQADNKQDTLYIAAGSNVSIAADETNDKITIGLTGIVPVANGGTGVSSLANITVGNATADASGNNIANTYAKKTDTYAKTEVDTAISAAINSAVAAVTKTLSDNMHAQYPVGSYICSDKADNPATYLPYMSDTTWVQTAAGRVLIGAGTADSGTVYTAGATGGEEKHTLTTSEMPSHNHAMDGAGEHNHAFSGVYSNSDTNTTKYENTNDYSRTRAWVHTNYTQNSGNHTHSIHRTGDGKAHNNMPPYVAVFRWVRTA